MKQRALAEDEAPVLGSIDFRAGQVGRQQIGRELKPVKVALDAVAQHLDRARLRQTRRALDEQVPVAQQRDQHSIEQRLLPHDEGLQVRLEP